MKIAIICPYIPERDGVTSFTQSFVKALQADESNDIRIWGVAEEDSFLLAQCADVNKIRKNKLFDYIKASEKINKWCDIAILQHSHDAFGGENGIYILSLVSRLNCTLVSSFHQVSQNPTHLEKKQVESIGYYSSGVVAFSGQAMEVLEHIYKIPFNKLTKIEYGVGEYDLPSRNEIRKELGFDEKRIIFSYGYLNREKALHSILNALPSVYVRHSDVHFVFIGQTDHKTLDAEGEGYRFELDLMIQKSGMADRVTLIDKHVNEEEILKYLIACDLFITPFIGNSHIQSSVLTQGMACGAAMVSTPYWHSNELLSDNRGEFVSETSAEMMTEKINSLLSNTRKLDQMRQSASDFGKHFKWSKLITRYQKFFNECIRENKNANKVAKSSEVLLIPKEESKYLDKLSDTTGMIMHASSGIPLLKDGYSLEDNALALILSVRKYEMYHDKASLDKINLFMSFIQFMQKEDGGFFRFLSYDRQKQQGSTNEIAFGSTLWALGELMAHAPNSMFQQLAKDMFFNSAHIIPLISGTQGMAYVLIGISKYLSVCNGDELMTNYAEKIVKQLLMQFKEQSQNEWNWFESSVTQADSVASLALIHANAYSKSKSIFDIALKSLSFIEQNTFTGNYYSPIGRKSKLSKVHKKVEFDQYAIDMLPLVLIYEQLFKLTGDATYMKKMKSAFMWYMGDNSLRKSLYDHSYGGCCQSLTTTGVSTQEGADSGLAFWLSYYSYISTYNESLLVK